MSIDEQNFKRFVDELKDKADLVEVIQAATPEFRFSKRGKYWVCQHPDSLHVDPNWQIYTHFGKVGIGGHTWETGDVFDWLQRYRGMDFWQACQWLAERYGVPMPKNIERNEGAVKAARARYELYEVAHEWMVKQLRGSAAALDYCRRADEGRAFADETICGQATAAEALVAATDADAQAWKFREETIERAKGVTDTDREKTVVVRGAGLGFSGGAPEAAEDLRKTLGMYSIDLETPEAVALIGKRGGVKSWCEKYGIQAQSNWLKGRIWGMVEFPRLIYPHFYQGKLRYFSGRGLAWKDGRLISDPDKAHKAYNPPRELAGERQRYFNWLFNKHVDVVIIVEGQADAITLGEWGYAAIALCGLAADEELVGMLKQIKTKYIALDADERGQEAMFQVAQLFGPMARLVSWPELEEAKNIIEENNDDQRRE